MKVRFDGAPTHNGNSFECLLMRQKAEQWRKQENRNKDGARLISSLE